MKSGEFLAQWSMSPLIRFTEANLEHTNLRQSDRDFLVEVGLPVRPLQRLRFDALAEGLQPLSLVVEAGSRLPEEYYLLGEWTGHGGYVCLHIGNGNIVTILPSRGMEIVFMNSNLELLAEFFLINQRLAGPLFRNRSWVEIDRLAETPYADIKEGDFPEDEEVEAYVEELENNYILTDPSAMESEENVWPRVLSLYFG